MKRIIIDIATGQASDGQPIGDVQSGLDNIRDHLAQVCGGYTEVQTQGGWIDPRTQKVIREPGEEFTMIAPDNASADDLARYAGLQLQQYAVAVLEDGTSAPRVVTVQH